ncbi:substrate-binding domain-containing protein [Oscillospiraceae bacterium HCP3S3_D12]
MKLRKITAVLAAALLTMTAMTACSGGAASSASSEIPSSESSEETTGGDMTGEITVLSREDGSGTRGAFIELFGIEQKNDAGEKEDMTTDDAQITNSTSVMMTTVQGNPKAIGYISLGSLDESVVKAVEIDGAAPTVENVKAGTYKVVRPFNIATKGEASEAAQDFINFIMSADGQKVVSENGYITVDDAASAYAASGVSGKVVVGGSSSVTPVMEKLKEAYMALNPDVTVEVQQSDSTTGMTSTIDGAYDIGMASRELKDSELEAGLTPAVIAQDGIAVIVNKENTLTGLTSEQVLRIYTGETTDWSELP